MLAKTRNLPTSPASKLRLVTCSLFLRFIEIRAKLKLKPKDGLLTRLWLAGCRSKCVRLLQMFNERVQQQIVEPITRVCAEKQHKRNATKRAQVAS